MMIRVKDNINTELYSDDFLFGFPANLYIHIYHLKKNLNKILIFENKKR